MDLQRHTHFFKVFFFSSLLCGRGACAPITSATDTSATEMWLHNTCQREPSLLSNSQSAVEKMEGCFPGWREEMLARQFARESGDLRLVFASRPPAAPSADTSPHESRNAVTRRTRCGSFTGGQLVFYSFVFFLSLWDWRCKQMAESAFSQRHSRKLISLYTSL